MRVFPKSGGEDPEMGHTEKVARMKAEAEIRVMQ